MAPSGTCKAAGVVHGVRGGVVAGQEEEFEDADRPNNLLGSNEPLSELNSLCAGEGKTEFVFFCAKRREMNPLD